MRLALDKIVQLYKTSPVFQDLLETAVGTGVAAGGQALFTDMTPQEIALASGAAFGAGMIGRPLMGRAGQQLGKYVDKNHPGFAKTLGEGIDESIQMMGPLAPALEAKVAPYRHLGPAAQYANLIGRGYGDNIAQAVVALAAPGIFGNKEEGEK